jgi:hypothetical protein
VVGHIWKWQLANIERSIAEHGRVQDYKMVAGLASRANLKDAKSSYVDAIGSQSIEIAISQMKMFTIAGRDTITGLTFTWDEHSSVSHVASRA